jgi:site-specific DNA recombinase
MNEKNQLAAIYCRVSSERQEKEGTVDSQIAEVEKAISVSGDICVKRYVDDGYSGDLLERPALDQLRTDASKRLFSKVYILSPDRLARKHHYAAIIMEDLGRYGVEIVFVNRPIGETIEDKLLFNVQSVISEYEKAKILDRLRRGKLFKIRSGSILGNTPVYGYNYIKDEKSRRGWYEINEKEAETVRLIFSIYLSDNCSGLGGVRKELYKRNIKTRGGSNHWSQSMVARIISNETYAGTTHWGKFRSVEGDSKHGYRRLKNTKRVMRAKEDWLPIEVPPIIDRATFATVAVKRAANKSFSPEKAHHDYLLRGLLVHSCGAKIYSKVCHEKKYYMCSSKRNAFPAKAQCDSSRHYNGEDLESLVWNGFVETIQSPSLLLRRIDQKANNKDGAKEKVQSRLMEIEKAIARDEEKKNRLVLAYSEGVMTLEELRNQKDGLEKGINARVEERDGLAAKLNISFEEPPQKMDLKSFSQRIKASLSKLDVPRKQKVLQNFISQILLDGNAATVYAVLPRELLVAPTSTLS